MSELKPCAHCGNEAEISETEGCDFVIACNYCGVSMLDDMHWNIEGYNARQNVIDKWNTRAAEQENQALKAMVAEMQRAYQQRLVTMTNEEVDEVFSKTPQQSLDTLKAEIADPLQYKIDELMLEYCPDEMTMDQMANWESHQRKYQSSTNENQTGSKAENPSCFKKRLDADVCTNSCPVSDECCADS